MPPFGPIKRRDFIYYLRKLGFEGPYAGGSHQYMIKEKENITLIIPNPHASDIGVSLLTRLLRQAKVDKAVWEKL